MQYLQYLKLFTVFILRMLNCYKSILSEVEASAFSELIKGEGEAMGEWGRGGGEGGDPRVFFRGMIR